MKHLEDIHVTFGQVLFLGGAKVYVTPRQWFLFHEVGADIVTAKTRYLGSTVVSDYDTKLGLAGGLGLQRRDWEFRAWLIVPLLLDRVHHARIDPGISILATARWAFARF